MLFVFRAINFCVLGAIVLAPFWTLDSSLDRLLPSASDAGDRAGISTSAVRERVLVELANLKGEIRADMCRRDAYAFCALGICPLRLASSRCPQK